MLGHSVLGSHFGCMALTSEWYEMLRSEDQKVSPLPLKLFSVSEHLIWDGCIVDTPTLAVLKARLDGALGSSSRRCALGVGANGL